MPSVTPGTRSTVFTASVGVLTLCSLLLLASSAPSADAYVGYPNSIAVLAHSGATGENIGSCAVLASRSRANSWATGTNPAVNSVYLRILAENPEDQRTQRQPRARERLGSRSRAPGQAGRRTRAEARADSDPDHGSGHGLPGEGARLPRISLDLRHRAQAACPRRARVEHLRRQPVRGGPLPRLEDAQPCRAEEIRMDRAMWLRRSPRPSRPEGGSSAREDHPRLRGAARSRLQARRRSAGTTAARSGASSTSARTWSSDLNHFSIKGHAKAAAVAWAAMKRAGLVPRSG